MSNINIHYIRIISVQIATLPLILIALAFNTEVSLAAKKSALYLPFLNWLQIPIVIYKSKVIKLQLWKRLGSWGPNVNNNVANLREEKLINLKKENEIEFINVRKNEACLIKILKEKGINFYKENFEEINEIENKLKKEILELILW